MGGLIPAGVTFLSILSFLGTEVVLNKLYRNDGLGPRNFLWTLIVLIMSAVYVIQPLLFPSLSWYLPGLVEIVPGVLLVTASHCLHLWARITLGKMYGYRDMTGEQHRLVNTGPYHYIRHPLYVSYFLLMVGLFFVNVSVITGLTTVGLWLYFGYWIRAEEKSLSACVPGYEVYMRTTPRFFPQLPGERKC